MKVFLNERSIPERVADADEFYSTLTALVKLAGESKKLSNNQQIQRHRELKHKEVIPGKTLIEYINDLGKHPDPQRRKVKALLLELFAKAPFLVGVHNEKDQITDQQGNCLRNSCFDDASACRTGAAIISMPTSEKFRETSLNVESSLFGRRKILNITTAEQLQQNLWIYSPNGKHEIPRDVTVDGEVYSAMHLTEQEAQRLLSNGFKVGKCVFNRVGTQWYKFHCHEGNIYHGFPINVRTPYKEYSAAYILFEEIGINENGQLFEDLLEIRTRT